MTARTDKLISVVWNGVTINEYLSFRSDVTIHEQLFFELKLKQPLNASPFKAGIDDHEQFREKPITLNFESPSGETERIIANIVRVAYAKIPGQQPEIIIGGTMYRPSQNVPKFSLLAIGLFILPVLFLGGLLYYAYSLQHELVAVRGNIQYFKDDSYKKHKRYTFKVSPYHAKLYREYTRHIFETPSNDMASLFTSDYDGFHKDSIGQPVRFYLFRKDSAKLSMSNEQVTFFDLSGQNQRSSRGDHFLDLLNYAADQTWLYFTWLLLLVMEVLCFTSAYYYYKMHSLFHRPAYKVLWWVSLGLSSVLNFIIVMTIA